MYGLCILETGGDEGGDEGGGGVENTQVEPSHVPPELAHPADGSGGV